MTQRRLIAVVAGLTLLSASFWLCRWKGASAQDGAQPPKNARRLREGNPTLEFIRIQVPKAKLHRLASQRPPNYYLPMKADRFDEALAKLRQQQAPSSRVRVTRAVYQSRPLDSPLGATDLHSLTGYAEWHVELEGDEPVALPIGNCGLAMEQPTWKGVAGNLAELGLNQHDQLALIVRESGVVRFEWSLRGTETKRGSTFDLTLPHATVKELYVTLPDDIFPELKTGVVEEVSELPSALNESPLPTVRTEERIWRLELGGVAQNTLTLREEKEDARPQDYFSQEVFYRLSLSGLELQVDLELDDQVADELLLSVSPGLRMDARVGDTPVPLEDAGPQQMLLRLPPNRNDTEVKLLGVSEVPLDKLWTLPRVRVENANWREGETQLVIDDRLALRQLELSGCRQTDRRRLGDDREEIRLREESAATDIRVHVAEREQRLQSRSGISVRWGEDQLTADTVCEFGSVWGEVFVLRLQAPFGWQIDSVETEPANAIDLEDLQLEPARGVLELPLLRSVSPQDPLTVRIRAHRDLLGGSSQILGRMLLIGRPLNSNNEGYLAFRGEVIDDGSLARVNNAAAELADLVEPLNGGMVVRDDTGLADLQIRKPPLRPEYRSELKLTAIPGDDSLEEVYEARCVPNSGAIQRVRIQASAPIERLHWTVEQTDASPVKVDAIGVAPEDSAALDAGANTAEDADGNGNGMDKTAMPESADDDSAHQSESQDVSGSEDTRERSRRWDIVFPRPIGAPFTLRASRERPLDAPLELTLLSLPEAVSQKGAVQIANSRPVLIEAPSLEKLPIQIPADGTLPTVQAAFRYEPATPMPIHIRHVAAGPTSIETNGAEGLSHTDTNQRARRPVGPRAPHIWSQHVHSRIESSGAGHHVAHFVMETRGATTLRLAIPDLLSVLRVTVNGESAPIKVRDRHLSVRLPENQWRGAVRVVYRSDGERLGWRATVKAPLLKPLAPVMESQWTVDLPPGYDVSPESSPGRQPFFSRLMMPFSYLSPRPRQVDRLEQGLMLMHDAPDVAVWGQLLSIFARHGAPTANTSAPRRSLRIHAPSMAALRLTPDTPLQQDFRSLAAYGLELTAIGDEIVLLQIGRGPVEYGLAELRNVITVDQWTEGSFELSEPSIWPLELGLAGIGNGLKRERPLLDAELDAGAAILSIRRYGTVRGCVLGLLVITAGLTWSISARSIVRWWAIGWTAAWLAPTPWAWCGAAIGWGALLGLLIQTARLHWRQTDCPMTAIKLWAHALIVMVSVGCGTLLAQAPQQPNGAPTKPVLLRVLIPLDEENEPEETIFVPLPLWQVLDTVDQSQAVMLDGWLLTNANYRLTLDDESTEDDDSPRTATLSARYQIRTFQTGQEVLIPMRRSEGPVVTAGLDGIDTNFHWNKGEDHLAILTSVPGVYDLTITRRVNVAPGTRSSLSVEVPRLPTASLAIDAAGPDGAPIELDGCRGSLRQSSGRLYAQLGAASSIRASWNMQPRSGAIQVEEHLWLQVKRIDSVVLRAMFRYQSQAPLQELRLLADPRLRLVEMKLDEALVTPVSQEVEDGTILTLQVSDDQRNAEVTADFHLKGVSGIGRIIPPRLSAMTEATARRWFAVTVGSTDLQARFDGQVQPLDSQQFSVSWPEATGPLQAINGQAPFDVVVTYAAAEPVADQVTRVTLSRRRTFVEFDATLEGLGVNTFQHQLHVPTNFEITELDVWEGGARLVNGAGRRMPHRFGKDNAGNLTVFLDRPASSGQRIRLRGHIAVGKEPRQLPQLKMASAAVRSHRIRLLRTNEVGRVQMQRPVRLNVDTQGAGEYVAGARLVGDLYPEGPDYSLRLRVAPNRRRVMMDSTIVLKRRDADWVLSLQGRFAVEAGDIGVLRVRSATKIEPQVAAPSSMRLIASEIEGENEWQLIPDRPMTGDQRLIIEAPAPMGDDGVLRVPDVSFVGFSGPRFLALPQRFEGQPIRWGTPRGLQAVDSGETTLDGEPVDLFEIVDRRFEATLLRTERTSGTPLVMLADVHAHCSEDHTHGTVSFDLEPAGRKTCAIEMPVGGELLNVTVNGVGVYAQPIDGGLWEAPLGPAGLPQHIVVNFRSPRRHAITAPTLSDVTTARTIWTVTGDVVVKPLRYRPSLGQLELWRSGSICTMLDLAADSAGNRPVDELRNWYEPWARRLLASEDRLSALKFDDTEQNAAAMVEFHNRTAEKLRVSQRLGQLRQSALAPPVGDRVSDIRIATQGVRAAQRFAVEDASARLDIVSLGRSPATQILHWLLASAVVIAATSWGNYDRWQAEWPDLFLGAIGVALIVGLATPWVGCAVLVLAMLRSLATTCTPWDANRRDFATL